MLSWADVSLRSERLALAMAASMRFLWLRVRWGGRASVSCRGRARRRNASAILGNALHLLPQLRLADQGGIGVVDAVRPDVGAQHHNFEDTPHHLLQGLA